MSGGGFGGGGALGISTLTNSDAADLKARVPEIESMDSIVFLGGTASYDNRQASQAILIGTGIEVDDLLGRTLTAGRGITADDLARQARVVKLDWLAAQALFPDIAPVDAVGRRVTIMQSEFEVVGVVAQTTDAKSMFSSFNPLDNRIAIPLTTAQSLGQTDRVNRILIRVRSSAKVDSTRTQIEQALLSLHGGEEDFTVFTQSDLLKTFNSVFSILTNAVAGIAAISLIVGGIGIMNIMLVAVAERTREIGIRKAVGATDADILTQFLIESASLGLLGGAIGLGLSVLAGFIIDKQLEIPSRITTASVVLALGISISAGLIFGVVPALRAARKNPVEALRYE
jgi:putative ABC transport system permease protein